MQPGAPVEPPGGSSRGPGRAGRLEPKGQARAEGPGASRRARWLEPRASCEPRARRAPKGQVLTCRARCAEAPSGPRRSSSSSGTSRWTDDITSSAVSSAACSKRSDGSLTRMPPGASVPSTGPATAGRRGPARGRSSADRSACPGCTGRSGTRRRSPPCRRWRRPTRPTSRPDRRCGRGRPRRTGRTPTPWWSACPRRGRSAAGPDDVVHGRRRCSSSAPSSWTTPALPAVRWRCITVAASRAGDLAGTAARRGPPGAEASARRARRLRPASSSKSRIAVLLSQPTASATRGGSQWQRQIGDPPRRASAPIGTTSMEPVSAATRSKYSPNSASTVSRPSLRYSRSVARTRSGMPTGRSVGGGEVGGRDADVADVAARDPEPAGEEVEVEVAGLTGSSGGRLRSQSRRRCSSSGIGKSTIASSRRTNASSTLARRFVVRIARPSKRSIRWSR